MSAVALSLFLALASAPPAAAGDDTGGDTADMAGDTADAGAPIDDGCASGGVNTGLLVVFGLGMAGLARPRRR